jgi:MoaA/NifB/PqqE/SkfB family radical SAM enzyme
MQSTNRKWQNHLKAKGLIPFLLDRVSSHARSSLWQHERGSFDFPINDRELDDALSQAFFALNEHFPTELYIEVTSRCNLDCLMCVRSMFERKTEDMPLNLFKGIVDEIVDEYPLAYVHLYGIGDPLMDETLFEKLDYAGRKGMRNTILFTNGQNLLKDDNYKKLADSSVPIFGVDIDGFTAASYEQIRRGGSFDTLIRNVTAFKKHLDGLSEYKRLEIAYQIYAGINDTEQEMQAFVSWCEDQGLEYKFVTLHTWADLRSDVPMSEIDGLAEPNDRAVARTGPCCSLWNPMILSDGRMTHCFLDANGKCTLGNVGEEGIRSIWQNAHRRLRANQVKGIYEGVCKECGSGSCVELPGFNSRNYPDVLRDGEG